MQPCIVVLRVAGSTQHTAPPHASRTAGQAGDAGVGAVAAAVALALQPLLLLLAQRLVLRLVRLVL